MEIIVSDERMILIKVLKAVTSLFDPVKVSTRESGIIYFFWE